MLGVGPIWMGQLDVGRRLGWRVDVLQVVANKLPTCFKITLVGLDSCQLSMWIASAVELI